MKNILKIYYKTYVLIILSIGYFFWSQFSLYNLRKSLKESTERIYNIADHLELWKEISTKHGGFINFDKLNKDPRNITITKVTREEGFISENENDILYILTHDKIDSKRKKYLSRYFSELVLGNYFSIITDKSGKIKEMDWDKP